MPCTDVPSSPPSPAVRPLPLALNEISMIKTTERPLTLVQVRIIDDQFGEARFQTCPNTFLYVTFEFEPGADIFIEAASWNSGEDRALKSTRSRDARP